MAESSWEPAWWTDEHSSHWERVKHALRRDWEQTKGDLADNGVDLNQGAGDTIRQALGKQPIPKDDLPNPGPRHPGGPHHTVTSTWPALETAVRYGYGARLHYEKEDWNESLTARLQSEWEASNQPRAWDEVKVGVERGWHSGPRPV